MESFRKLETVKKIVDNGRKSWRDKNRYEWWIRNWNNYGKVWLIRKALGNCRKLKECMDSGWSTWEYKERKRTHRSNEWRMEENREKSKAN